MAVVNVEKLWSGRAAGFGVDGRREYTAFVRVTTNAVTDSELTVIFAAGVPRFGQYYVSSDGVVDLLAICQNINPRQDESNGFLWLVECTFSTDSPAADPNGAGGAGGGGGEGGDGGGGFEPGQGGQADDPTLEPPEWEFDWEERSLPMRFEFIDPAADPPVPGPAILNAAGDPFDPLPEYETGFPVLVYSRTEAAFDAAKAIKYAFSLNKTTFLGLPPLAVQCKPIRARSVWKGKTRFWRPTYRFRFRLDGKTFQPQVLNAGFRQKVGGVVSDILDPKTQMPVSIPVPLDVTGAALSLADIAAGKTTGRTCKMYRVVDFAPLNITI